jgi:hypothetical protein
MLLCRRHDRAVLAKSANIWLSGQHVADNMSATLPAKQKKDVTTPVEPTPAPLIATPYNMEKEAAPAPAEPPSGSDAARPINMAKASVEPEPPLSVGARALINMERVSVEPEPPSGPDVARTTSMEKTSVESEPPLSVAARAPSLIWRGRQLNPSRCPCPWRPMPPIMPDPLHLPHLPASLHAIPVPVRNDRQKHNSQIDHRRGGGERQGSLEKKYELPCPQFQNHL